MNFDNDDIVYRYVWRVKRRIPTRRMRSGAAIGGGRSHVGRFQAGMLDDGRFYTMAQQ